MGRLASILGRREPVVHLFDPDQTVADAVMIMAQHQIGAVPIMDGNRLVGVFSERDLLRRVIAKARPIEKTRLREVMTPDPITAVPDEDRESALHKMRQVGCRHLPVVVDGKVQDMLSMRDLLYVEIAERKQEIRELRDYIHGPY